MLMLLATIEESEARQRGDVSELEALIVRMADGDTAAMEPFYLRTKTAVYGFGLSILKHHHNAEEIMQETYIQVYRGAGSYRAQGKPMAWLLAIVRNLALMRLREKNSRNLPLEDEILTPPTRDFTQASVDRMVLYAALAVLSDEERQIVMLHALSGLKHREIATMLEMPLPTVLSKYRRALKKLELYVKEDTP